MKSKTAFINKGILHHDFKSFSWMGVLYLLSLLFAVPLQIFMLYSQETSQYQAYNLLNNPYLDILQKPYSLQIILVLVVPVLVGLVLFRYLQSGKAVDMLHALPIKRETLYNTHISAGIIFLFIPIIITALLSWVVIGSLGIELISSSDIMEWLGRSLLLSLLLFISSVAVGMFTGMSSLQGILTYIMFLLPTGLGILVLENLNMYIYGFARGRYDNGLEQLSPLLRVNEFNYSPFSYTEVIVYLIIVLALYIIGRYGYRRRKSEMNGNAITFAKLRPVFKYGVSFCTMLLLGTCFYFATQNSLWTYSGYLIGSLIGFFLAEILIKKSINIFELSLFRQYARFAVLIVILLTALNNDVIGYEKRIPDLAEVNSAYFDHSFYKLREADNNLSEDIPCMFMDDDNIANIYELHKSIIASGRKQDSLNYHIPYYAIAYQLNDGSLFYREFRVDTDYFAAQLKPIYDSKEYKYLHHKILQVSPTAVDLIEISAWHADKKVKISDPLLIKQAVAMLQKDAMQKIYEQEISKKPAWATIRIYLNNESYIFMNWDKSDKHFGNWVKSIGEYKHARAVPEDIEYAVVVKWADKKENNLEKYHPNRIEAYLHENRNKVDFLKITDPEFLESCLQSYTYMETRPTYYIIFLFKDGNTQTGKFSEDNAPECVKEYFAPIRV